MEKQKQREQEAEEKIARRRQQALGSASLPGLKPSSNAWRPTIRRTEGEVMGRQNEDDNVKTRPAARWNNNTVADRSSSRDKLPPRSDGSSRTESPSGTKTSPAPAPAPGRYIPPAARRAAQ